MNGPNYDYLKLRKEEVIYKGSVRTNTRVLPLHTASSRASARDHVTWNAGTNAGTVTCLKGAIIISLRGVAITGIAKAATASLAILIVSIAATSFILLLLVLLFDFAISSITQTDA